MQKSFARFAVMCIVMLASVFVVAQTKNSAASNLQVEPKRTETAGRYPTPVERPTNRAQDENNSVRGLELEDGASPHPPPHIKLIDPPAMPSPWLFHDQISWAANLVLVIVGYIGVIVAVRVLATIKRQMNLIEAVAQAAVDSAYAATMNARAVINSQRPWILMAVKPSRDIPSSFEISATNYGRTPAEIVNCPDRVTLVVDDLNLPKNRVDAISESDVLRFPITLLPCESTTIQRFGRSDVKWVCTTEEKLGRVERSEETIFIYGTVIYKDLILSEIKEAYRTDWCFRYVHGESISDLVVGGPPEYNRHT